MNSDDDKALSMQNRMKSFHLKWVSLTFLGVQPNLGFWPRTPGAYAGPGAGTTAAALYCALLCSAAPCLECCTRCTPFPEHPESLLPHCQRVLPQDGMVSITLP